MDDHDTISVHFYAFREDPMSRFWSQVVRDLTPYVPGEQPKIANLIKLNTNESPFPPSPKVMAAIQAELGDDAARLRLYPDPNADLLKNAIAQQHSVTAEQVFVGNGSDEVLAHVFMALLKHDAPILFPDITYSFYPVYCGLYGVDYRTVPLAEDFSINPADYCGESYGQPGKTAKIGGIIFPNPNAPTGRLLALDAIEQILKANPDTPVIVDEAYVDFGGGTAIKLVERYDNLLVVHTLSKSRSLAGMRVGFAVGHPALIEALERVKNSFNSYPLDRLAIVGAVAAMEDQAYFAQCCSAVIATREILSAELHDLGFEVLPSAANFIFARHAQHDAAQLATSLREKNIIVRHFKLPRIDQFLRITVGTEGECKALTDALRQITGSQG
jgi:histidinol-phosphate aminotransferase